MCRTPRSLDHGDSVVALARSDTSADSAFDAANGHHIQVLRGDLSDPVILAKGESVLSLARSTSCCSSAAMAHQARIVVIISWLSAASA